MPLLEMHLLVYSPIEKALRKDSHVPYMRWPGDTTSNHRQLLFTLRCLGCKVVAVCKRYPY